MKTLKIKDEVKKGSYKPLVKGVIGLRPMTWSSSIGGSCAPVSALRAKIEGGYRTIES